MATTATITIGRNVQRAPMARTQWEAFKDAAYDAASTVGNVVTSASGSGYWNGVREGSYTVVATLDTIDHDRLRDLRYTLRRLTDEYRQDCIALTIGETELIGA